MACAYRRSVVHAAAFQARDGGLLGTHALGDFGLPEAGAGAGLDQLRDQREFVFERVVFGTHSGSRSQIV